MREIRFRAWDTSKRSMYFWSIPEKSDGHITTHKFLQGSVIIMQSTGLKDKSGKEIYKGDIIKYHDDFYSDPNDIGGRRHVVKDRLYIVWWHPLRAAFWRKSIPGVITSPILSLNCEVIGNIYENEDLLKEKEKCQRS